MGPGLGVSCLNELLRVFIKKNGEIIMKIVPLSNPYYEKWNDYIRNHRQGLIFHSIKWMELVTHVLKYKPLYYAAVADAEIVGILPLFYVNTWLSGKKMISVPGGLLAGILADSNEIELELSAKAQELAREYDVQYLELRQADPLDSSMLIDTRFHTVRVPIVSEEEQMQALRPNIRRALRRSLETEMRIEMESKDVKTFYTRYSRGMRNFGTPVESCKWIKGLFDYFPDNHFIANVYHDNRIVNSQLIRIFNRQIASVFAVQEPDARCIYPNHRLIWELFAYARKMEIDYFFDFGRSIKDSGPHKFKTGWGGESQSLHYHYYLVNAKKMPDLSQTGGKRQILSKFWKKLPLPVANTLGPKIRRCFP